MSGGDGEFTLFVRGRRVKTMPEAAAIDAIADLVANWER